VANIENRFIKSKRGLHHVHRLAPAIGYVFVRHFTMSDPENGFEEQTTI